VFAKLYETEEHGQILVMLDSNDENGRPQVKVYFEPDNLGVCSVGLNYNSDITEDEQWSAAEKSFNNFTEEFASGIVKNVKADISGIAATQ